MNSLYAMQRANGDWFALNNHGHLSVPVFSSSREAMAARARNPGMLLFKPVVIDAHGLRELAPADSESGASFILVDDSSVNLQRGRPIDHGQLALLIHDSTEQTQRRQ